MSEGSLEHQVIQPSNLVSTGVISFRDGNPVIQFIISEQDKHLLGNSLRFTGNIQFFDDGAVPVSASALSIDPKTAIYSCISELTLKSQRSKQVIENIRHYSRFLSSYLPALTSKQEAISHMSETSCMMPNAEMERNSLCNNLNGVSATDRTTTGSAFCVHLPCGLLNSRQPIPLSANGWGIGGLMLEISLQNDSQTLFANTGVASDVTDPYYQLSSINLICEVVNPSSDALSQLNRQSSSSMEYNSISSFYTSINSTNAIINFNLGLSKCLGMFFNVIPSSQLNNLATNGNSTLPFLNSDGSVADLRSLVFSRNGTKFPLQYNIDTNVSVRYLTSGSTYYVQDPQVLINVLDSFMPYSDNKRTQFSPITFTRRIPDGADKDIADGGSMWAVGCSFDNISNQGIDFSSASLGITMEVGLTTDNPNTLFLFVHHKNTLIFNKNGLQVIN